MNFIDPIFPEDIPSSNDTIDHYIIMGDRVQPGEIPWQAYLLVTESNGQMAECGGSLIRPKWVFTAAHCIADSQKVLVHLGGTNKNNMPYRKYADLNVWHGYYDPKKIGYDVGLVRLSVAASGKGIGSIPMAPDCVGSLAGTIMRVSGFGRTSSDGNSSPDLMKVSLRGITNEECSKIYGKIHIQDSTLCATYSTQLGQNTCFGDSGGPLTVRVDGRHVLAGIVSFVAKGNCEGYPSGYARVTSFRSWAIHNMDRNS